MRPPSYNEADVSDKPAYIRAKRRSDATRPATADDFRREQLETLLAVDDAVGGDPRRAAETGRLANTLVVFTSDNG